MTKAFIQRNVRSQLLVLTNRGLRRILLMTLVSLCRTGRQSPPSIRPMKCGNGIVGHRAWVTMKQLGFGSHVRSCIIHGSMIGHRLWTGDAAGAVVVWTLHNDEHFVKDSHVKVCTKCTRAFGVIERRHHCRFW